MRLNWKCRKYFSFGQTAKAVLSTLLVLQMLLLLALTAYPALHHAVHHDSDGSEHHCAATLFAHGQVDSPDMEVAAIIPAAPVEFPLLTSASLFDAQMATLPPGRGPPVSLLHS